MAKARKPINGNNGGVVSVGAPTSGQAPLKKRKKGGCLKAFIITLCVSITLIAAVVVGGLFIGDAVMKNNFGISLFDVFAVIGDLGDYDRDKIVTNGYGESDVDEFYNNANSMLYFKSGENAVLNSEYIAEITENATSGDSENLMAALLDIFQTENFDVAKLGAYEGWKDDVDHMNEMTAISDRQFAAFFNDFVLESGMIDGVLTEEFTSMFSGAQMKDIVGLEQLIVCRGEDLSDAGLARVGGVPDHSYMTFTLSLDIKNSFNAVLPSLDAQIGFPVSMFGWLIDWILPDMTYVTATVDLNDAAYGVKAEVNSLSSEQCEMGAVKSEILAKYADENGKITKMDRLLIVAESLSGTDLRETINESAAEALTQLCVNEEGFSVANAIDLDSITATEKGNDFKIDLYGMVAELLNEQTGGTATPEDIVVLMQALVCTTESGAYSDDYAHRADLYSPMDEDLKQALAACGFNSFEDIKTEDDYYRLKEAYGAIGYKTTGAELTDHINVYEQEFMDALERTYCLDLNKYDASGIATGEKYTFDEIASLFGIESGDDSEKSLELIDLLDGVKLAESAGEEEDRILKMTDRMLGAIMSSLLTDYAEKQGYGGYGLELRTLKIEAILADDEQVHNLVTVTMTLKISEMMTEDVTAYVGGVLPEYVTIGIKVDMTPNMAAESRLAAEISCYNDIVEGGKNNVLNGLTSEWLVAALERIIPDIDLDGLLSTMSQGMSSVVDNMTSVLPSFAFLSSGDNSTYYAAFPTIFDTAVELLGLNDESKGDDRINGDELKSAVDYIVNYGYDSSNDVADNASYVNVLSSVQQNYYLDAQLTNFDSIFNSLNGQFNANLLRLNQAQRYSYGGASVWYNGMLYDPRSASSLTVSIDETALTAIMREFAPSTLGNTSVILRADVTNSGITLYVGVKVSEMMQEKYRNLLACEYVYAAISIDLSTVVSGNSYDTTITLNGQNSGGDDYGTLMRLIRSFGAESFNIDDIAADVGRAAYDSLSKLTAAKIDYTLNAAQGTIVLPSFYDYAMKLLDVDTTTYTAADMKAAMQGIRQTAVNTDTDKYYVNIDGTDAAANANNFNASAVVTNPLATSLPDNYADRMVEENGIVWVYDNEFGYKLKSVASDTLGDFKQLSAIPSTRNANATSLFGFANGFNGSLNENAEYLVLTFETDFAHLFAAGGNLSGVLPTSAYMTLVYEYDGVTNELSFKHLRVNGLTEKQQTLLIEEICGAVDFDSKIGAHNADAMNMFADYDFNIDTTISSTACGILTLELSSLIGA